MLVHRFHHLIDRPFADKSAQDRVEFDSLDRLQVDPRALPFRVLAVEPDLDTFYFNNVIGGPGAIMVPAQNFESFAEAILKKLIQEIATLDPDAAGAPVP